MGSLVGSQNLKLLLYSPFHRKVVDPCFRLAVSSLSAETVFWVGVVLSKTVATSHMGLLSPCDVANVTEEVN